MRGCVTAYVDAEHTSNGFARPVHTSVGRLRTDLDRARRRPSSNA